MSARALILCLPVLLLVRPKAAQAAPPADDTASLKKALTEVLKRAPMEDSRVAVEVLDLRSGKVLFHHDEDELLNPASNVKLFTAAAALSILGPDFRFETDFLSDTQLRWGRVKTLYVKGHGDPTLNTERLYEIVSELHHLGLRRVGDLVIDDTYFDQERNPPGYEQEDSDRAYMAPTGAVTLNLDTVGVYVRPTRPGRRAAVELEPPSPFFEVENHAYTRRRGRWRRVSVTSEPDGDRQRIVVRGSLAPDGNVFSVWKKIDDPPMYFGQTFRKLLEQRGIKVTGKVTLGKAPDDGVALLVHQSETFDLVLKQMDKLSSNFTAEQLIKTLGAEKLGPPGTTEHGVEVVEDFLAKEVGIPRGTYVMKNGSGLNDTNRFSVAQISRLLKYMYDRFPLAPEYLSSMGIAARDGTLRYRFEDSEAAGRLRAKTGTLSNASALSGYVESLGGQRLAFSILVNDYPGRLGPVVRGLDAVGTAVTMVGSSEGPVKAVAQLIHPKADSKAQILARIRTYLTLAQQSDRRNLEFLRTALRTEKDPAVRAVVADAIYQSNPQDYFGAQALLDSYSPGQEVYGALREVARSLKVEVPGLGSVVELAAEGNQEAVQRVLELAQASAGDAVAEGILARALSEVARTAPEEMVLALKSATDAVREAATGLLARGLAQDGDAHHPFWPSVHRLMASADPQVAAFARKLEGNLSRDMAQAKSAGHHGPAISSEPNSGG